MAKIAIVIYSTYGHILALSKAEAEGVKAAGATVDVYQLPSGEPNDASASSDLPIITPSKLAEYDGILFGIPSRYGTHPYAFKAFFDATGAQWASGSYYGKYAGFFVTTGTQGGGQESVVRNSVTVLVHHGLIYVPLGYARAFSELADLNEVHGGSPWGAGSFAGPSGARQPSKLELDTARIQGKSFAETVIRGVGSGSSGVASGAYNGTDTGSVPNSNSSADTTGHSGANASTLGTTGVAGAGVAGAGALGANSTGVGSNSKSADDFGDSQRTAQPSSDIGAKNNQGSEVQSKAGHGKDDLQSKIQQGEDNIDSKTHGNDVASSKIQDAEGNVNSAPAKGERAVTDAEDKAEKGGCCKCVIM